MAPDTSTSHRMPSSPNDVTAQAERVSSRFATAAFIASMASRARLRRRSMADPAVQEDAWHGYAGTPVPTTSPQVPSVVSTRSWPRFPLHRITRLSLPLAKSSPSSITSNGNSTRTRQCRGPEVSCAHPYLDRSEWMLGWFAAIRFSRSPLRVLAVRADPARPWHHPTCCPSPDCVPHAWPRTGLRLRAPRADRRERAQRARWR